VTYVTVADNVVHTSNVSQCKGSYPSLLLALESPISPAKSLTAPVVGGAVGGTIFIVVVVVVVVVVIRSRQARQSRRVHPADSRALIKVKPLNHV
jgi:hypothetical protein